MDLSLGHSRVALHSALAEAQQLLELGNPFLTMPHRAEPTNDLTASQRPSREEHNISLEEAAKIDSTALPFKRAKRGEDPAAEEAQERKKETRIRKEETANEDRISAVEENAPVETDLTVRGSHLQRMLFTLATPSSHSASRSDTLAVV